MSAVRPTVRLAITNSHRRRRNAENNDEAIVEQRVEEYNRKGCCKLDCLVRINDFSRLRANRCELYYSIILVHTVCVNKLLLCTVAAPLVVQSSC